MRYPTAKTIQARLHWLRNVGDPAALAKRVRAILDGTEPSPQPPGMYNPAGSVQCKLEHLNRVLETFGVEYVRDSRDTCTRVFGLEYLNTGYSYTPTIYFNHERGAWNVGCISDVIERRRTLV